MSLHLVETNDAVEVFSAPRHKLVDARILAPFLARCKTRVLQDKSRGGMRERRQDLGQDQKVLELAT